MLAALLLVALIAPAQAADAPKLKCPDGRAPLMTGHPFVPLACPPGGKEPEVAALRLSTAMAPLDSKGGSLQGLDGRWEGLVYFAGRRFECILQVSDGGKKGTWEAMDYATHLGHAMEGTLKKPGWFSKAPARLQILMPHLPGASLAANVWLAPGVAAWRVDDRQELHRVEYMVDGDHLSGRYTGWRGSSAPVGTTFDLTRRR